MLILSPDTLHKLLQWSNAVGISWWNLLVCFHFSKITRSLLNLSGICWIRHDERLLSLEAEGLSGINDVYILWISFIYRSFNARHLLGIEVLLVQNEQHSPCKWEGKLKGGMLCIELAYHDLATLLWKWIQIKLPLCKQARWGIFFVCVSWIDAVKQKL